MFSPTPLRRNLEAALRDLGSKRVEVRASAARDLGLAGQDDPQRAALALEPLLGEASSEVRAEAALALGELGVRASTAPLEPLLDDADSTVRQHAVIALGRIGGARAIEVLAKALAPGAACRPDVRYQALLALGDADAGAGVACALVALGEDDVWIASEAATMLGAVLGERAAGTEHDRARAREALRARLDRGASGRLALAVSMALVALGDERGRAVIAAFVRGEHAIEPSDDAGDLRLDAIERLGALGGTESLDVLTPVASRLLASSEREAARAAMARAGDADARARIVAQLGSVWAPGRDGAIALAAAGRVREAVPALVALLRAHRGQPHAIVNALGAIGGPQARDALEQLVSTSRDAELVEAARDAIARI